MNILLVLELIYLFSAVLCAVSMPLNLAYERSDTDPEDKPLREYFTKNDILLGAGIALIGVFNTFFALRSIYQLVKRTKKHAQKQ